MDIVTTVPVRLNRLESLAELVEPVKEKIARRAYELFASRECVHGSDLEDWLNAERELIVNTASEMRRSANDIIVEVFLSETDLSEVSVHVSPTHLVILSEPNEEGRQVLEVIALPASISFEGVDAERDGHVIRIAAALDDYFDVHRATA